jgi:glycerol-3-phosphate cytidylyltransferase
MIKGYATGVFDLFHIGHLNILKSAKAHCDYLVVGVTTDELSMERKGKLPIIPLAERMEIVSNLKFVDEVVVQSTMDKFAAWEQIKFDRMFAGSDWKGSDKWNELEKQFGDYGVEIIYFPYTESTSSTIIRKLIEQKIL